MKNGKQAADTLIWIYIIKLLRTRLHGALTQLKYVYTFTYLCLLDSKYFRPRKLHTKLDLTDVLISHYEKTEEVIEAYWKWKVLVLEAVTHIINDVEPKDRQGQDFAKRWVEMVAQVTEGRHELIEAHKAAYENRNQWPEEDRRLMEFADEFIDKSVESYLTVEKEK